MDPDIGPTFVSDMGRDRHGPRSTWAEVDGPRSTWAEIDEYPLSSPTNLAACRHPLQVNAQAPLLISVQDLVQPELSNCIQLLQLAHTKCLLGGGLFFGGILLSTDSIDGIALKKAVFSPGFPPGEMFYTFLKSSVSLL